MIAGRLVSDRGTPTGRAAKLARRTIKDCDKRIANFETALGLTEDADTIAGFARQIERTRAERKGAEIRLRRLTTGRGMIEDEIREVVRSLADAVNLL